MDERFCRVGDIELCYETFGDPNHPPVLLIMGLATQMVAWHVDFCRELVDRGFHVIRFDNRDIGRSTRIRGPVPGLAELARRDGRRAPYDLVDMAGDAVALLAHLGIGSAHVVGASMGGMIAQTLAFEHPERVRSLTSIMSTTGHWRAGRIAARLYPMFMTAPPGDRDGYIERTVGVFKAIGTPGEREEEEMRALAGLSYDRGYNPAGAARHLFAIFASGDRTERLRQITAPTLVIHGTRDPMVSKSGGVATARAIPGARLELLEGMGHDLPRSRWPRIVELITEHARSADAAGRAAPSPVGSRA